MRTFAILTCLVAWTVTGMATGPTNELSLAVTNLVVMETDGAVTVSVTRAGIITGSCSVELAILPKTALPGRDFIPPAVNADFGVDQTNSQWIIPLLGDTAPEPSKIFLVIVAGCSNAVPGVVTTNEVRIRDAQTDEIGYQDFEAGLPAGWSVTTNADEHCSWRFDNPGGWPNNTGGDGGMAIADSDAAGLLDMDTELRTAPFIGSAAAFTYLVFKTDYYVGSYDIADVDLSLSGSEGPWTNLWRKNLYDYPGPVMEMIDLTPWVMGQSNNMVRFHYYNAYWDGYWQIDDVAILVESDVNTNGLPDWWEKAYFKELTNVNARLDSDNDGLCNMDEFIAGTSPVDTGECFRVAGLMCSGNVMRIAFDAAMAHFYEIQCCSNLAETAWSNRDARVEGRGGSTNISVAVPRGGGFYRLTVDRW